MKNYRKENYSGEKRCKGQLNIYLVDSPCENTATLLGGVWVSYCLRESVRVLPQTWLSVQAMAAGTAIALLLNSVFVDTCMLVSNHTCPAFTVRTDVCVYIGKQIPRSCLLQCCTTQIRAAAGGCGFPLPLLPLISFSPVTQDDNDLCCAHLLESFNVTITF